MSPHSLLASFIGSFHPLLVHLPLGILLVALGIDARTARRPDAPLRVSLPVLYGAGAVTALLSCLSGYLLLREGSYEQALAGTHQWLGLSTAFLSVLQWMRVRGRLRPYASRMSAWIIPTGLFILLLLTGHYGGSLTHGKDYLLTSAPAFVQRIMGYAPEQAGTLQIEDVQQAGAYKDLAAVILDRKCVSCHGPNKQKGGLRLDAPEWIRKGGEDGSVLASGNPEGSELIKRILLPREDEDHMPPREKSQLTREEIAYLHWWVRSGADFNRPVHALAQTDSIRSVLTSFEKGNRPEKTADLPAEPDLDVDIARVDSLEQLGLLIMPLAEGSRNLEVSFINCTRPPDSVLSLLQGLSAHVMTLNLGGKPVTDAGMLSIGTLSRLRKLYLGNSLVTDKGLSALAGLGDLRYLNLTNTRITQDGLDALRALPKLRAIYLAGTDIQPDAWPGLRRQFRGVYLDSGGYRLPLLASDTETVKETKRR